LHKLLLVFLFISQSLFAQIPVQYSLMNEPVGNLEEFIHTRFDLGVLDARLVASKNSPGGSHHLYKIFLQEYELDEAFIKLNLNRNGNLYSIAHALPIDLDSNYELQEIQKPALNELYELRYWKPALKRIDEKWIQGWLIGIVENDLASELFVVPSGEILNRRSMMDAISDTTVKANVFRPDPLTTAEVKYGAPYLDNNDQTNGFFLNQLVEVDLELLWKGDSFQVWNDYARSVDRSPPNDPPYRSQSDFFKFNRSNSPFEEVNALYHFSTFLKKIENWGFDLIEGPIDYDAHAFNGDDFAAFNRLDTLILFGQGGVDDAEDADIVIHELGHALSFYAAPQTNGGFERRGFDEAICDYFASSYSYGWSPFNYKQIFNWDGHNEFWPGRDLTTNEHYPEDLGAEDFYQSSLIYSGMLSDLMDELGPETMDQIVLQSLYGSFLGMEFPQAAVELVMADSNLYNAEYKDVICNGLKYRGILDCDTIFRPVNFSESSLLELETIVSTRLRWYTSEMHDWDIQVYDLSGRQIFRVDDTDPYSLQLNLEELSSGMYMLHLTGDVDIVIRMLVLPEK